MRTGCPVKRLWELLEQRHEDKVTLPEGLRQALWACLLERLEDISVCEVGRHAPEEGCVSRCICWMPPGASVQIDGQHPALVMPLLMERALHDVNPAECTYAAGRSPRPKAKSQRTLQGSQQKRCTWCHW